MRNSQIQRILAVFICVVFLSHVFFSEETLASSRDISESSSLAPRSSLKGNLKGKVRVAIELLLMNVFESAGPYEAAFKEALKLEIARFGGKLESLEPVARFTIPIGPGGFNPVSVEIDLREIRGQKDKGKLVFAFVPLRVAGRDFVFAYRNPNGISNSTWAYITGGSLSSDSIAANKKGEGVAAFYAPSVGYVPPEPGGLRNKSSAVINALLGFTMLMNAACARLPQQSSGPMPHTHPALTVRTLMPPIQETIPVEAGADPNLTNAMTLTPTSLMVAAPAPDAEDQRYTISVASTQGTTLSSFHLSFPSLKPGDTAPRFEASRNGSTLAVLLSTHDANSAWVTSVKLFDKEQGPIQTITIEGRSADSVKRMHVLATPFGPRVILLYADNTLEILNGRTGERRAFAIGMEEAGSLLVDLSHLVLYVRSSAARAGESVRSDEILKRIEILLANSPSKESTPVSTSTTAQVPVVSAPVNTLTPTATLPLPNGGRMDFEQRTLQGQNVPHAVIKDRNGDEKQAIPVLFGSGTIHAEPLALDPNQIAITRGDERQIIDVVTGKVFVRLGNRDDYEMNAAVPFYQTNRYIVTENIADGARENAWVKTLWLRDMRLGGEKRGFLLNSFGDWPYDTCSGSIITTYAGYRVTAFPLTRLDWTRCIQVVQLHDQTGRLVAQTTLEDDTGQYSGVLLMKSDLNTMDPYFNRSDIFHFIPYTATEPRPQDEQFLYGGMFRKDKAFNKTLQDLFPNVPGLEPPGVIQSLDMQGGKVSLERDLSSTLGIYFRDANGQGHRFAALAIAFGDGPITLSALEGPDNYVQIIRGNERQIIDPSNGKAFVSIGNFKLFETPLYTASEDQGKLILRSGNWGNQPKVFSVEGLHDRLFGPYKVVTAVLRSNDQANVLSVVQLWNIATGKFVEQVILGPENAPRVRDKEYTGLKILANGAEERPDRLHFVPQDQDGPDPLHAYYRSLQELFVTQADLQPAPGILQTLAVGGHTAQLVLLQDGSIEVRIAGREGSIPIRMPTNPGLVRLTEAPIANQIYVETMEGGAYQVLDLISGNVFVPLSSYVLLNTDRYTFTCVPRGGKKFDTYLRDNTSPTPDVKRCSLVAGTSAFNFRHYRVCMIPLSIYHMVDKGVQIAAYTTFGTPMYQHVWREEEDVKLRTGFVQLYDEQGNLLEQVENQAAMNGIPFEDLQRIFPNRSGLGPALGEIQRLPVRVKGREAVAQLMGEEKGVKIVVKYVSDGSLAYSTLPIGFGVNGLYGLYELKSVPGEPDSLHLVVDENALRTIDLATGKIMARVESVSGHLPEHINFYQSSDYDVSENLSQGAAGTTRQARIYWQDTTAPWGVEGVQGAINISPSHPVQSFDYRGYRVIITTLIHEGEARYSKKIYMIPVVQLFDEQGYFVAQTTLGKVTAGFGVSHYYRAGTIALGQLDPKKPGVLAFKNFDGYNEEDDIGTTSGKYYYSIEQLFPDVFPRNQSQNIALGTTSAVDVTAISSGTRLVEVDPIHKNLRVIDVTRGNLLHAVDLLNAPSSVVFTADENYALVGMPNTTVLVDLQTGVEINFGASLQKFGSEDRTPTKLVVHPNGKYVFGLAGKELFVADIRNPSQPRTIRQRITGNISNHSSNILISPDGMHVFLIEPKEGEAGGNIIKIDLKDPDVLDFENAGPWDDKSIFKLVTYWPAGKNFKNLASMKWAGHGGTQLGVADLALTSDPSATDAIVVGPAEDFREGMTKRIDLKFRGLVDFAIVELVGGKYIAAVDNQQRFRVFDIASGNEVASQILNHPLREIKRVGADSQKVMFVNADGTASFIDLEQAIKALLARTSAAKVAAPALPATTQNVVPAEGIPGLGITRISNTGYQVSLSHAISPRTNGPLRSLEVQRLLEGAA